MWVLRMTSIRVYTCGEDITKPCWLGDLMNSRKDQWHQNQDHLCFMKTCRTWKTPYKRSYLKDLFSLIRVLVIAAYIIASTIRVQKLIVEPTTFLHHTTAFPLRVTECFWHVYQNTHLQSHFRITDVPKTYIDSEKSLFASPSRVRVISKKRLGRSWQLA